MDTWKLPLKVWFWAHDATASLHPEVKKTHLFIHVKLVSAKAHLSVNTAADIMASIFFHPPDFTKSISVAELQLLLRIHLLGSEKKSV